MTVTLPPAVAKAVSELVEDGFYPTPEAALQAAMQALDLKMEHERKLAELRAEIRKGLDDLDAGRVVEMTPEWLAAKKARIRQRAGQPLGEAG